MNILTDWFAMRRIRKRCFHHSLLRRATPGDLGSPAISYIESRLIDTGCRKMFWCTHCERTWFT